MTVSHGIAIEESGGGPAKRRPSHKRNKQLNIDRFLEKEYNIR